RIAGKCLVPRFAQGGADRRAARVGVLDDCNSRRCKFGDQLEGSIRIAIVVVGELLALELPRGRHPETVLAGAIECGRLVWILPVAQPSCQTPSEDEGVRKGRRLIPPHPFGYRGVV